MIDSHKMNSLFDAEVVDPDGSKVGTVKHVYVDPDGGQPLFVGVTTGWFGMSESFVPLRDADFDGEVLHVEYDKDTVKHAPRIDADGTLTDDDIDRIQDYYDGGGIDESGGDERGAEDARRRTRGPVVSRDDALPGESIDARDQRPPRKRIRVHRYVVADERTGASSLSHDDATSGSGRTSEETRYESVEESHVDRLDGSRESGAAASRDLGPDEVRRPRG